MEVVSLRFGCPQNLDKKNALGGNPIPTFVANEKGTNPDPGTSTPTYRNPEGRVTPRPTPIPQTTPTLSPIPENTLTPTPIHETTHVPITTLETTPTPTTSTPPSREGRGREIGPAYIPGDIDGFSPKTTTKHLFLITPPTEPARPAVTRPPSIEPIVSTPAVTDNVLGPSATTTTHIPHNKLWGDDKESTAKPGADGGTADRSEELTEKPFTKDAGNEVDARRPGPSHSEAATIEDDHGSGTSGMFFTAFLIILGILVTAMIVTIAVFIYLRATRSGEVDMD